MTEAPHDYWARRAGEEARLALAAADQGAASAHGELARAYRARARMLRDGDPDRPPEHRRAAGR